MITKPYDPINRATPLMPWLHRRVAFGLAAAQDAGWATLGEAWDQCPDVEWLLWALARISYPGESILRLFACRCVRETPLSDGRVVGDLLTDPRSWAAVETAERFARDQARSSELTAARDAAWTATMNATGIVTWAAAWAAHAAAWAAQAAALAAAWTTWRAGAAIENATWAATLEATRETIWAVAWAARAAVCAADGSEARAAAGEAAAKFQVNLLRQMIDPFHADRS